MMCARLAAEVSSYATSRSFSTRATPPARASAAVMLELERVIRDNRFSAEGDIALVAREAAAILLARCLKAKKRADAAAYLSARETEARGAAESSAWSVASKYFAKLDGKAATDD